MGTRWRGLLAPLGVSTGDGRRFRADGVTHRALPLALKWQRPDSMGHDDSVVVGSVEEITMATLDDGVAQNLIAKDCAAATGLPGDTMCAFGLGAMFDDVSREEMPRLAEDVAEAMLLTSRRVVGCSVDGGAAEAVVAEVGSEEPLTEERFWELMDAAEESGEEPPIEMLFTSFEIAAATLVSIPAYAECRPFELIPDEGSPAPTDGDEEDEGSPAPEAEADASLAVALVAAAGPLAPPDWFTNPNLTEITPLTVTEDGRVYGHIAALGTCHAGIRDACVTPPLSDHAYAHFHRYTTTTCGQALPVPAGRLTVAHGALTGRCACCPGIDDHACNRLALGATIAHYDQARTAAYVVAGEDDHGIWVAGTLAPTADQRDRAALARQQVSGDWRDVAGHLELVEVLVLAREKPGFPLPRTSMAHGRQLSLVAAGAVHPRRSRQAGTGVSALARQVAEHVTRQLRAAGLLPAEMAAAADTTPLPPAPAEPETAHASTVEDAAVDTLLEEIAAAQTAVLVADVEDATRV